MIGIAFVLGHQVPFVEVFFKIVLRKSIWVGLVKIVNGGRFIVFKTQTLVIEGIVILHLVRGYLGLILVFVV